MRKFTLFLLIQVFLIAHTRSQSITPVVIASSGEFYANPTGSFSATIGEMTTVETISNIPANTIFTQGFQQNELLFFLPAKLLVFTLSPVSKGTELRWVMAQETDVRKYAIETSANGIAFSDLAIKDPHIPGTMNSTYTYIDSISTQLIRYYRIRIIENGGRVWYSPVVKLSERRNGSWHIYPQPAMTTLYVEYSANRTSNDYLIIYSMSGFLLSKQKIVLSQGSNLISTDLSQYPAGNYILQIGHQRTIIIKQ